MSAASLIAERFEIGEPAGTGGMGIVYRARDRQTGEAVAVKLLHEQASGHAARFLREAHVLAQLRHPAIVRYVAHGETADGRLYLAMEWLDGETLSRRLRRAGLTVRESVAVATRVAEALAAAHGRRVIHRDVKPSNVFLPAGDVHRAKVLDFGIAQLVDPAETLSRTGSALGTLAYLAPERARREHAISPAVDVFSLGCVLFECLTGRPAFAADNALALLGRILFEETPRVSDVRRDVAPELSDAVARMMSRRPEDRLPDGEAALAALRALATVPDGPVPPVAPRPARLTQSDQCLVSVVVASFPVASAAREPGAEPATPAGAPAPGDAPPPGEVPASGPAPARPGPAAEPTVKLPASPADRPAAPELGSWDGLRAAAARHGARLEILANGSVAAFLSGGEAATDLAVRAARLALAIRTILPEASLALTTGPGGLSTRSESTDVIERAATLLDSGGAEGAIRLDDVSAGLLDGRLQVEADDFGYALRRSSEPPMFARRLLGRPTSFVGREAELQVIESTFDACCTEPGARAILVTGGAGLGKSRLRDEAVAKLGRHSPPAVAWVGWSDPVSAGAPFALLGRALRRTFGIAESEPVAGQRNGLVAGLTRVAGPLSAARLAPFLGETLGIRFEDAGHVELRSARQSAIQMGDRIRQAWLELLESVCAGDPLVLVLDDVHGADPPSLKLVDAALRRLRRRPFLVLAFARPEVHERFPRLWAECGLLEIGLRGLSARAGQTLVREVLGDRAATGVVATILERADGNPFFLEELIRSAATGSVSSMPATIAAMLLARFDQLPREAREVLRAASVFGEAFRKGGVAALLGGEGPAAELPSWLGFLFDREMIEVVPSEDPGGEASYRFRHAMVRDAVYSTLTEADRALGHRLAGRWLESIGEPEARVVAAHFERANARAEAAGYYHFAAAQAIDANDWDAALDCADKAARCGASGDALGGLRALQAEAHLAKGETAEAATAGEEALELIPQAEPRWHFAAGTVAIAACRLGQPDRLRRWCARLLAAGVTEQAAEARAIALAQAAIQLFFAGTYDLLPEVFRALDAARARVGRDAPLVDAWIARARATEAKFTGDVAARLELNGASVAAHERAGDVRNALVQRCNLADTYKELGLFETAADLFRRALADADRLGLPSIRANATYNLASCLGCLGRFPEAKELGAEGIRAFLRQGDRYGAAWAAIYMAVILLQAGELEAAERESRRAVDTATAANTRTFALGILGATLLAAGRGEEALAAAEHGMKLLESLGTIEEGEALLRLAHVESLRAAGQEDRAREMLGIAWRWLMERAGRIGSEELRGSFVRCVPEHARIVELARALGVAPAAP